MLLSDSISAEKKPEKQDAKQTLTIYEEMFPCFSDGT